MNILVIATKLLTSYVPASSVRIKEACKDFKDKGHSVTYIAFYTNDSEIENLESNNIYYDKIIPIKLNKALAYINATTAILSTKPLQYAFYQSKTMHRAIQQELLSAKYDILYVYCEHMTQYIEKYDSYKRIADFVDAAPLNFASRYKYIKSWKTKLFSLIEGKRQYNYEKHYIDILDKVLYISEYDRQYMTDKNHENKTMVMPISINTDKFYNVESYNYNQNEIIYLGLMSYIANHDAVMYFIKQVFPLVKNKIPNAVFKVIGGNPRKELLNISKKDPSVIVTGWVDDVREHIKTACVSSATIRIGAGIQNKILETMSMGVPTVTTEFGAGGITDDRAILPVAHNAQEFADKIVEIMNNRTLRNELSEKSREFCISKFSTKKVIKDYEGLLHKI